MKKNKLGIWFLVIAVLGVILWQTGVLNNLFVLSPVTINPATCTNPTMVFEKILLSDTVYQSCYPYSHRYPTIQVFYDAKTGSYLNTISGDQMVWGYSSILGKGPGALSRCYKCDSAEILSTGGTVGTKVLTDKKIANPLGQASAFAVTCEAGLCQSGWLCKSNGQGTYFEYNGCNSAPSSPVRFCGNGIAENGETRDNCCKDVSCAENYRCSDNQCVYVPSGGGGGNPMDEDCGNNLCESGENQSNCCTDCGCPGSFQCINNDCRATTYSCGNNVCEANETCTSCPVDCGACECNEGQIDYVNCGEGWKTNIWQYRQCINRLWEPVSQGQSCFCLDNGPCAENYKCQNNICVLDIPTFCTQTPDCKVRGFYCDETKHSCEKCPAPGNGYSVADCEFSEFACLSNSDCFNLANDYCTNWQCVNDMCTKKGIRFENCCSDNTGCEGNMTCGENHLCQETPTTPKKPTSLLNIFITLAIIGGIGVLVWLVSSGKIKLPIGGK